MPAPVSPVRTLMPGPEFDLELVDDGEAVDAQETDHGRRFRRSRSGAVGKVT